MKRLILLMIGALLVLGTLSNWLAAAKDLEDKASISGEIIGGYRVLPVPDGAKEVSLSVYRGDYIKFKFNGSLGGPLLSIPALSIEKRLPADLKKAPYFKMKTTGTFDFSLGGVKGRITVVEYKQPHYKAVTSEEAAELIHNISPFILDVRTPGEYKRGHLQKATLIPVQELQSRWREISDYKNQDILIYCASGNRSTVASKILIDHGFKRIYNLRHGIADWGRKNFPVIR